MSLRAAESLSVRTPAGTSLRDGDRVEALHHYSVYGMTVTSDAPLALPRHGHGALGQVECRTGSVDFFRSATDGVVLADRFDSWYRYAALADGSTYVGWDTIGEFVVAPDGRRITCRRADDSASNESFQVYMLGQALSFALVKQQLEPLHATVVVVNDRAVAFLGHNGSGKSTLAACFLEAGYRVLTDDLLLLQESANQIIAYPGPPRIKLFPLIAKRFLGDTAAHVRMNADSAKLIVPLDAERSAGSPVELIALYSLAVPRDTRASAPIRIETLSPRQSFVELLRCTFNRRILAAQRLSAQFQFMARMTDLVAVRRLSYPRVIDRVQEVRAMVLADVASGAGHRSMATLRPDVSS